MPSRNPYGCVFCPTYLLAFLVVFFLAFAAGAFLARGFAFAFASAFTAAGFALGAGATGAATPATPATRISTWLVRLRIGVPRPIAAAVNRFSVWPSFTTA